MWLTYLRQVLAFILIFLGAVLGIAAVYIAPSTSSVPSDKKSKPKKVEEKQNPVIVVHDLSNNKVNAEVHPTINHIQYGNSTVLDIINNIKNEVLNILDSTGIKLFIPDAECSNNSSNYEDANSEFEPNSSQTTAPKTSNEPINSVRDASTIYKDLPNENINAPSTQRKIITPRKRENYSGLKNKSKLDNPSAQSTLVDSNVSANVKSGFILSFKNPKSPIRRAFRRMINLLRIKNNLSPNTNKTPKTNPTSFLHSGDYSNNGITLYI